MKVALTVNGTYHSIGVARALSNIDMLWKYYPQFFIPYKLATHPLLPLSLRRKLLLKSDQNIPSELIAPALRAELRNRILFKLNKFNVYNACQGYEYSVLPGLIRDRKKFSILHAWDSAASIQFEEFTDKIKILELGQSTPTEQSSVLLQEIHKYKLDGTPEHYWGSLVPELVNKRNREIEQADKIIVASEFVRNQLIEQGYGDKAIVIPYYSFTALAPHRNIEKKRKQDFNILCVAPLTFLKGVHYLVEAFKTIKKLVPEATLTLVGKLDNRILPVFKDYDVEFTHIEYMERSELMELYDSADVYVMPSLAEGSSLTIYEAFSRGLPIIATESSGSVIQNGINGIIVKRGDSASITEAVLQIYSDPALKQKFKENAHATAEKDLTIEGYIGRVENFYQNLKVGRHI